MMREFPYSLAPSLGNRAALGLIVLQADETIEHDFRRLLPETGVSLNVSRIKSGSDVSRDTLGEMERHLPQAASLLPPPIHFDAVGYACTSGTSVIGEARVEELVQQGCRTRAVTNPLTALVAACRAMGLSRIALLSPYVEEVSQGLRDVLAARGIATPLFGSFNEAEETRVARIDAQSLISAGEALVAGQGASQGVQALFMSCTNLRALEVIAPLEAATGLPVLSSNTVLAWHMLALAGQSGEGPEFGRLARTHLHSG